MKPGWIELTRTPSVGPVHGDALGQRADGALGRVVGRRGTEPAAGAEDRADVDHRPVRRGGQRRRRCLHPQEHASLVDIDRAAPVGQRCLLDNRQIAHSGVVDQDVKRAEVNGGHADRSLPLCLRCHVQMCVGRLAATLAYLLGYPLPGGILDVGDQDRGALGGKPPGNRRADPAACPGHQGHPPSQPIHSTPRSRSSLFSAIVRQMMHTQTGGRDPLALGGVSLRRRPVSHLQTPASQSVRALRAAGPWWPAAGARPPLRSAG